jgi:hypothetical protein
VPATAGKKMMSLFTTQYSSSSSCERNTQTLFRNLAPAHNTGAKCVDMLKPNNEANQSIAVTATGTSRSSVWWRKGRALYPRKVMMK